MIKVSIIVPIYNAGSRLRECLETLINQTLREIEIICVLDCPTDGSEKIAEEYASNDNRIKLIYNETNLHVGESRNRGIALAQGEYIGFSDADDYRKLDMYSYLYKFGNENEADIVISNSNIVEKNEILECKYNDPTRNGVIKSIILPMSSKLNSNFLSKSVWASIYKKDLLLVNDIRFNDYREVFSEDTLFNLSSFLKSKKIYYVDKPFYYWVKHDDSLSNQWVSNVAYKSLNYHEIILDLLIQNENISKYRNEWIESFENSLRTYYSHYIKLSSEQKTRMCKLLIRGHFPLIPKYRDLKILSKKRFKLYAFIFRLYLHFF